MAQSRFYSSAAQPTVLIASITPASTVVQVQAVTGFPLSFPYVIALDYGTSSEELVLVTNAVGTSLTVTRSYDGTSAASHNAGAAVRHTWAGSDGNDARLHEGSTSAVHGVVGTLVGTTDAQTLSAKTLTNPNINSATLNGNFGGTPNFTAGLIGINGSPAGRALSARVSGDSSDRLFVRADGGVEWGSGTGATDVLLSRTAANIIALALGDSLQLLNTNAVTNSSTDHAFQIGATAGQNLRMSGSAIHSANAGAASTLDLMSPGGNLQVFIGNTSTSSTSLTTNNGRLTVSSPNTGAITHVTVNSPVGSSASAVLLSMNQGAQARFTVANTGTTTINTNAAAAATGLALVADAASTGDIILAQQGANTKLQVTAGGNLTAAGTGTFLVETQTTGLVASAGWTVGSFNGRKTAGIASIRITMVRSGANITASAAGNITETDVCTIPAGWRTPQASVHSIYANAGAMDGDVNTDSAGLCTISTLSGGATITTGDTMVFNFTYVL